MQLQRLASESETQGLGFFAAVSLHNLMEVERARGRFHEAYAAGERALGLYGEEGFGVGEAYGTHERWRHVPASLAASPPWMTTSQPSDGPG